MRTVSWRVETAPPVVAKIHKPGVVVAESLRRHYEQTAGGKRTVAQYEPDSELRDIEPVPPLELDGIEAFFQREVCTTFPMRRSIRTEPRSPTKSHFHAIPINQSRCGLWKRSARMFLACRGRPKDCWTNWFQHRTRQRVEV